MLGKTSVYQLMNMSGHVLVGLSSSEKVEHLIEEGLTIGSTLLRPFPYRKRAEKIIIGNFPIAVKDDDIVAALRPYCKVASMAYELVTCEGYSWTTGSRKAFIFMNEGLKIHQLPVKLDIKKRGEATPAYISYGVKCSKCHYQGHRRASCPRRDLEECSTRQPTSQHGSLPPSTQTSPSSQPAATTPAAVSYNGPDKTPAKNVPIPMKPPSSNKTSGAKALPAAAEVATPSKENLPNIAAPILTIAPGSRVPFKTNPLSKKDESSTETRSKALRQLKEVLRQLPDTVFENTEAAGMEREGIVQAIISERSLRKFLPDQKPEQLDSLINLIGTIVDRVEDKACHLYKRLTHLRSLAKVDVAFVQEMSVLALNNIRDLCLGYSAVFAPSSTPRGSDLAVVVALGVTVLWHRVLWLGKISIASINIRGLEIRVINCHLSHTPEERNLQLKVIAEEAIREDAWALGDWGPFGDLPSNSAAVAEAPSLQDQLHSQEKSRKILTFIKNSRQQKALSKVRSTTATFEQSCFIERFEWCSDFSPLHYIKALEGMLVNGSVFQIIKMPGQVLIGLASVDMAERLVEEGLNIANTPYKKRAENVVIGNIPFAVKDEDIVAALRPYCSGLSDSKSIIFLDGKLDIKSKGETTPAYITYGVRCSKCHPQGHRRVSCPRRDMEERSIPQASSRQDPALLSPST
ncbi:hypothetical protein LAZ67_9002050 [Cordylochernes scorpioides]|uniref:CCHC-type domain-containing protein n=1 Tax=Cordylochernes scorpioides TaxID=51811 RepID=A0ABY6KYH1_9ARAC|nr:hypothetical protein LAZ67_9002050 [Cordylochernes scorpioides]